MVAVPVIELVDSEILASSPDIIIKAPGYALVDAQGITTGEPAFSQSRLLPQHTFHQYWQHLSLAPLANKAALGKGSRLVRHFGDLAYAQLSDLHRALGRPQQLILALPGTVSNEQLSILLGLANALPVTTVAMVDSAVAATASLPENGGQWLHLELQLHQMMFTRMEFRQGQLTRTAVQALADCGLSHFYNAWSQYLANRFIREYRYDPLHSAAGEQQIYDRMPQWLSRFTAADEALITLETARGTLSLNFNRRQLLTAVEPQLARLQQVLGSWPTYQPIASYRFARLPGLAQQLGAALLPENATYDSCQQQLPGWLESDYGTRFITDLPCPANTRNAPTATAPSTVTAPSTATTSSSAEPPVDTAPPAPIATHILHNHCAYAIGDGLGISAGSDGPVIARDSAAALWISQRDGVPQLQRGRHWLVSGDPAALKAGDQLRLDGHTLIFIRVDPEA